MQVHDLCGRFRAVLPILILLPLVVRAETWNWTGAGSTPNWSDSDNWIPSGPPANNTSADITFFGDINAGGFPTQSHVNLEWEIQSLTFDGVSSYLLDGEQLTVGSGNIRFGSSMNMVKAGMLSRGPAEPNLPPPLPPPPPGYVAISNVLAGAASLTVDAGTVTLSGTNSYSGGTVVNSGTLLVSNNVNPRPALNRVPQGDASGTGTGAVTVNSGGTLGGTGSIEGTVTVNGGTLSPGDVSLLSGESTIGALTLNSNVTFAGVDPFLGTYQVDLGSGTNNCDRLTIGGMLDLTSASDAIIFSTDPDGTSSYILASYASRMGVFDVELLPDNYQLIYGEHQLILTPIPEPGTWAAGLGAAILLAWRGRLRFGVRRCSAALERR